jgi:hypothetical protein
MPCYPPKHIEGIVGMHPDETRSSHQGSSPCSDEQAIDALFGIRTPLVEASDLYSASCLTNIFSLAIKNLWEARRISFRSRGPERPWSDAASQIWSDASKGIEERRSLITYEHPIPLGLIANCLLSTPCADRATFKSTLVRLDVPCVLTVEENKALTRTKRSSDNRSLNGLMPDAYKDAPIGDLPCEALLARYEAANAAGLATISFPDGMSPRDVSRRNAPHPSFPKGDFDLKLRSYGAVSLRGFQPLSERGWEWIRTHMATVEGCRYFDSAWWLNDRVFEMPLDRSLRHYPGIGPDPFDAPQPRPAS